MSASDLVLPLLRALSVAVPEHAAVTTESADFTDLEAASRHADAAVALKDDAGTSVLGVVVEVQLRVKPEKRYAWPAYLANFRAKLRCDVELLVVTTSEGVARWASEPISLGQGFVRPLVVGPSSVPLVRDLEEARRLPELAVLSAVALAPSTVKETVAGRASRSSDRDATSPETGGTPSAVTRSVGEAAGAGAVSPSEPGWAIA